MNVFADRLFAALLGWTRSLFNGMWNIVTNDSAGVSGFLQRFWLPLIIVLLVFGTVCDYVIWLIRWRPYFVWRTWFRNQDSRRRLNITRHYMEDLDHAPLDLPEYQEGQYVDPAQAGDEPLFFNFTPLPQPSDADVLQDETASWASVPPAEYDAMQPALPEYETAPVQPQEYGYYPEPQPYQEGFADEDRAYPSYAAQEGFVGQDLHYQPEPQLPEGEQQSGASLRKRRTGSRRRQSNILKSLRDMLFTGGDNNETFDSLPAAVEQDDAFHKPYYPQNYTYKPNPGQPEQNDDSPPR